MSSPAGMKKPKAVKKLGKKKATLLASGHARPTMPSDLGASDGLAMGRAARAAVDTSDYQPVHDPSFAMASPVKLAKKRKKKKPLRDDLYSDAASQSPAGIAHPNLQAQPESFFDPLNGRQPHKAGDVTPRGLLDDPEPDLGMDGRDAEEKSALPASLETTPKRIKVKKPKDKDRIELEQREREAALEAERSLEAKSGGGNAADGNEEAYEDDDFEDYDDDFEEVDEAAAAAAAAAFTPATKSPKPQSKNMFAPDMRSRRAETDGCEARGGRGQFKKVAVVRRNSSGQRARRGQDDAALWRDNDDLDRLDQVGIQVASHGALSQRVKDLKSRISLQQCRIDVFEQYSLPKWEFYIRSVGAGGTHRQTFTQTNDDACDVGIQAEPLEQADVFCQGEDSGSARFSPEAGGEVDAKVEEKSGMEPDALADEQTDLAGLAALTRMIEVLIEETAADSAAGRGESKSGEEELEDLITRPVRLVDAADASLCLSERQVIDLSYSGSVAHILATAHSPRQDAAELVRTDPGWRLAWSSIVCIWDLTESQPRLERLLTSESRISKILLSPWGGSACVAGCDEGSLLVWDLREAASVTDPLAPVFNTAAPRTLRERDDHMSDVCCLTHLKSAARTGVRGAALAQSISFQFASLDSQGGVRVWTLLESAAAAQNHGESGDAASRAAEPGMSATGKLKLHLADSLSVFPGTFLDAGPISTCLAMFPNDASQLVVGTASGSVVHLSRFAGTVSPREYCIGPALGQRVAMVLHEQVGAAVSCIAFHPKLDDYFLVGYATGTIALFHTRSAMPLRKWEMVTSSLPSTATGFAPVSAVRWSTDSDSAFYVMDGAGQLCLWDLATSADSPILQLPLTVRGRTPEACDAPLLDVSSSLVRTAAPSIATADSDGSVTVRRVARERLCAAFRRCERNFQAPNAENSASAANRTESEPSSPIEALLQRV
mmetsp:Transcript_11369/g.36355  ORF Transcript_11369/g.36355 Transcript_11369/m.36355 type:complete len:949 (-) Transcript_11369:206-3052(-)